MHLQNQHGEPAKLGVGSWVTINIKTGKLTLWSPGVGFLKFRTRCSLYEQDDSSLFAMGVQNQGTPPPKGDISPEAVVQLICSLLGLDYTERGSEPDEKTYELVRP